ncbi:MAG: hypothetical protein EOP39_26370 [Rubrivivax sp.]|nr:MAG: hypothetical protein EOP39_26370 [Rubrivivax sp.]
MKKSENSALVRAFQAAALMGLLAGSAIAQNAAPAGETAQQRYQREAAVCNSGQSQQDRATCLQEAGAALGEARKGALDNGTTTAAQSGNAMSRCEVFTGEELSACRARAAGTAPTEGATITRGSVAGGGIIRETIQVYEVPAGTPGSTPKQ